MAKAAAGYVIHLYGNTFLSRSGKPVRHKNHSMTKGIQRSWVHDKAFVAKGGDWANSSTVQVVPAEYDPMLDLTVVTGEPMSFDDFVWSLAEAPKPA